MAVCGWAARMDIIRVLGKHSNLPFEPQGRGGTQTCMGGFASTRRGTHFQATLRHVENLPCSRTAIWRSLMSLPRARLAEKNLHRVPVRDCLHG